MRCTLLSLGLAALVSAGMTRSLVQADFQLDTDSEAAEAIRTLVVRIDVGADGDDLQEPVALDLGLGFPFWLHPLGQVESENAPVGAVPQQTTAGTTVSAGSSATFTFSLDAEAGQDVLHTTSQLLAGTQVSDIARIGFASQGSTNWILAGYEIQVNGRSFASNDEVNLKAQEAQDSARFELAELGLRIAPLEAELSDLAALEEAQLAEENDLDRLAAVRAELAPLETERRRLEGRVEGRYPWFEEPGFRSPWREDTSVGSAMVTLVTHTHPGADTKNYVFFRTGGHKYFLNTETEPLSGASGSQEFELDLLAGPLTAADMRGYAVGMLAHNLPFGDAPDRWHPQRMLVSVDGRIVYDSDESPIDHDSLAAIRVIPPAHVDEETNLVVNPPTSRETYLWEAGQGQGLDLVAGGALPLPPPDAPDFPLPEPSLPEEQAGFPENAPGLAGGQDEFPPGFGPFPGEVGGIWIVPDGGWGMADGGGIPPGGWVPPVGWVPWAGGQGGGLGVPPLPPWPGGILDWLENLVDLNWPFDAGSAGDPFQIESVHITEGYMYDEGFTVEWTVLGDESEIEYYEVLLLPVHPDRDDPFGAAWTIDPVPVGTRQFRPVLPDPVDVEDCRYVAPMVIAYPSDGSMTPHERIGPARAIYPPNPSGMEGWGDVNDRWEMSDSFNYHIPPSPPNPMFGGPVSFGGEPPGLGRAVWTAGEVESHSAILFDNPVPMLNIGMRPGELDEEILVYLHVPGFYGRHRLMVDLGFLGGSGGGNSVEVELECRIWRSDEGIVHTYPTLVSHLETPVDGPPEPMRFIHQVVDSADDPFGFLAFGEERELHMTVTLRGGTDDPAHPPALFGLRLVHLE